MNVISRGIRNAFRNTIRTFSIIVILGLSIGLSLGMLIATSSSDAGTATSILVNPSFGGGDPSAQN